MKFYPKSKNFGLILLILSLIIKTSCKTNKNNISMSSVSIKKSFFGKTKENKDVFKYILRNKFGMKISVITYGGIITSWLVKDKNNEYKDIVLGFNNLEQYENGSPYFGALIGRYGNRIANGKFKLKGKQYSLTTNDGNNHLHGGMKGFDKVIWEVKETINDSSASLELNYISKDMEEGYPGNLEIKVIYTLNDNDEFIINYMAKSDKTTIVNITQHSYFNLTGDFSNNILDHELVLNADSYLPVNSKLIPMGLIKNVDSTPFDFRIPKKIGIDINSENEQLKNGLGYDHCWVLNDQKKGVRFVASAYERKSGRFLEVFSDQPGIQFYSGNFLDGTLSSKSGGVYKFRSGFCLETQHYPDSPNHLNFPSTVLNPGEMYSSKTRFKFSVN